MVVFVIDVVDAFIYEHEHHAPVSADLHRPSPGSVTAQRMKIEAGQIHVTRRDGNVEAAQDQTEACGVLRLDAGQATRFEEPPQPLVPKALNHHSWSVTLYVTVGNY